MLLIAVLGGVKALQISKMIEARAQFVQPPELVTTFEVRSASWETVIPAIGSLTAVQGVVIAAELPGKVVETAFTPGAMVKKGELLLRQDTSSEEAQLPGAEAALTLASRNLSRAEALAAEELISKSQFDTAQADYRQAQAAVDNLRSQIDKKTIRAPFSGRLGIRLVNLGQSLREGDVIVSLQTLTPIFVDFQLPQQHLGQIKQGLPVRVIADGLGRQLTGEITAINPQVNAATRTVGVQATLKNTEELLRPGMFVNVEVVIPELQTVLIIPGTAVLYAPFGDSVFIVEEKLTEDGHKQLILRQQFIRLSEKRGDFVSILSGLRTGEMVVSTGVFKLRNGQVVVVDNSLAPEFKLDPRPENN